MNQTLQKRHIMLNRDKSNTKHCTVCGYQWQIHPQRSIQHRMNLAKHNLQHLHKSSNDQYKSYRLHIIKSKRMKNTGLQNPCDTRRKRHDKSHSQPHADSRRHIARHPYKRTDAEKLCKHDIIDKYRGNYYRYICQHLLRILFNNAIIMPRTIKAPGARTKTKGAKLSG